VQRLPLAKLHRLSSALAACCLMAAAALAQNPPAALPMPAGQAPAQSHPATKANDELLAKAGKLYYSTVKSGLDGFECAVHPDWRTFFATAEKGSTVAADDPRVVLLKSVKITFHARMAGNSSLDWSVPATADKPLDEDSTDLLDAMHQSAEQTLMGFMQFWSPFVNGSAVPASSEGLEVTQAENGTTLHAEQGGTSVTEVMDSQLVLKQFRVAMSQMTIEFEPAFQSTDQGLLVTSFAAHIQPAGAAPEKAQEMHVTIGYQTVDGFQIPAQISMNLGGGGELDFVLDGCTVSRQPK